MLANRDISFFIGLTRKILIKTNHTRGTIVSICIKITISKIKPSKEFRASSVAGGSIFKMDVTHQKATESALVIIKT